jgi:hypothetical protein
VRRLVGDLATSNPPALEIGAGMSLVAELYDELGLSLSSLILTDASAAMLKHSAPWGKRGARLINASVKNLQFPDASFGLIFCSLGDPYNGTALWNRVAALLQPGGYCVFTTPSFEWATFFRRQHQDGLEDLAEFLVRGKDRIYVPSKVLAVEEQTALIESSGLKVNIVSHVRLSELPGGATSPKLKGPKGERLIVVTGLQIMKPATGAQAHG